MTSTDTRRVARGYFDAWTTGQGPNALRELMSPEFVFEAGPQRIEGRDAFLGGGGWPDGATTMMVAEAYDGEHAFQLYAADHGHAGVRIAEHLTVRDGVLVASEVIADGASFAAFMAGRAS